MESDAVPPWARVTSTFADTSSAPKAKATGTVAPRMAASSISAVIDHLSRQGYQPHWLEPSGPHRKAGRAEIHAKAGRNGYVDVLFLKPA